MSALESATSDEASRFIDCIRESLARRTDIPLDTHHLSIEPVLNWGGFVNRSFRIADASSEFVLKLALEQDNRAGLERWRSLADILTRDYHAPQMIAWIELDACNGAGPLFEFVHGVTPERLDQAPLPAIARMLGRLHTDDALALRLVQLGDRVASCAEAFRRTYHRRFTENLAFIDRKDIPFVDAALMRWMRDEVDQLERRISRDGAFAEPAARPVHGDIWLNNIIVDSASFRVLDWDGLELGDPAMDWAMMMGPTRTGVRSYAPVDPATIALDANARLRLGLYQRAALLDWIIDPLADWAQSFDEPFHGDIVRTNNERVHREAVQRYRELYPSAVPS